MTTVVDFKLRLYNILEIGRNTVLLECLQTRDRVRVRTTGWSEIGFTRPDDVRT